MENNTIETLLENGKTEHNNEEAKDLNKFGIYCPATCKNNKKTTL